jgi:hypothetical protein
MSFGNTSIDLRRENSMIQSLWQPLEHVLATLAVTDKSRPRWITSRDVSGSDQSKTKESDGDESASFITLLAFP